MIVPYEKEIVFNTKIKEICSISLEYEANVLDEELSGDFILTGEYKIHELSVNKEPFKYRIPFSIELSDNIIRDSVKHDISNFTYEIVDDDTLKVNIEFNIEYEEVEEKILKEEEEERISIPIDNEEIFNLEEKNENEIDTNILDNALEQSNEIVNNGLDNVINEKTNNTTDNVVLNNSFNTVNTYVTYHIHVLDEGENIDSIALKYNISKDTLNEYNEFIKWEKGDKILIPENSD